MNTLDTSTIRITQEILYSIAEIDEFKGLCARIDHAILDTCIL
ncbi:hypothetical protein ACDY97_19850 [Rhizobium mongolense]